MAGADLEPAARASLADVSSVGSFLSFGSHDWARSPDMASTINWLTSGLSTDELLPSSASANGNPRGSRMRFDLYSL